MAANHNAVKKVNFVRGGFSRRKIEGDTEKDNAALQLLVVQTVSVGIRKGRKSLCELGSARERPNSMNTGLHAGAKAGDATKLESRFQIRAAVIFCLSDSKFSLF